MPFPIPKALNKSDNRIIAAAVLLVGFWGSLIYTKSYNYLFLIAILSLLVFFRYLSDRLKGYLIEREREAESARREGKPVLGMPPQRDCFEKALKNVRKNNKHFIDRYLVGFELDTGKPLWLKDDEICEHGCVFAKTGVGKTLWLESIIFQQMARGRASGCTFIDAKRDSTTLAHIILMACLTGRLEDLIIVDPFDPIHSYNFVLTQQRADVKARKVLRAGLPAAGDLSVIKHYDRLATDSIYRMVRALESLGFTWSIKDVGAALSSFQVAYPKLRRMLSIIKDEEALIELSHLASSYRTNKGAFDSARFTENLRGIAAELNAIAGSEMGKVFCTKSTDLVLTDAIIRGKIIYFMMPRLEEAESAQRMVKLFREDLEVSIGEITSSRELQLEDPHLVIIDEGSSTFGPTWANLFELARKGRFGFLFGAQSTGALTDSSIGLSNAFYERVMANVNLKVMMRVGDNRTAQEMSQWIGNVKSRTKTYSGGAGDLSLVDEDEMSLFSGTDELKHEMYAEKGLAWFDLGNGKVVKGRSFWFDADLPPGWDGRKFVPRYDQNENDDIGLAEWVDNEVLDSERGVFKADKQKAASAQEAEGMINLDGRMDKDLQQKGEGEREDLGNKNANNISASGGVGAEKNSNNNERKKRLTFKIKGKKGR